MGSKQGFDILNPESWKSYFRSEYTSYPYSWSFEYQYYFVCQQLIHNGFNLYNSPIGIFDSGVGGISVLRAIRRANA